MAVLLFYLVVLGVPTVVLVVSGLHLHRKRYDGWRRCLALALLTSGCLLAVYTLIVLSGLAVL